MKKVAVIFGTRPEAIKLAPVILELRRNAPKIDVQVVLTGQHRELLHQANAVFGIRGDHDLAIMTEGQTLSQITERCLAGLDGVIGATRPDIVVVQGDTTSAFAAALIAFYHKIPVVHVEAGLRTNDRYSPFPEEVNRRLVSALASIHFAPTTSAASNLLREGVSADQIVVTGNTSIDALKWVLEHRRQGLDKTIGSEIRPTDGGRIILLTSHRRESFGDPMREAFRAIARVVEERPDVSLVFPVHPNPNVRREVNQVFGQMPRVVLTEPLEYVAFCNLMQRAHLIVTDSGGIQEEAPSLDKPVVVLRDSTERAEGIDAGTSVLVGTDPGRIVSVVSQLLDDEAIYRRMASATNPFGDGLAAEKIVAKIRERLGVVVRP